MSTRIAQRLPHSVVTAGIVIAALSVHNFIVLPAWIDRVMWMSSFIAIALL